MRLTFLFPALFLLVPQQALAADFAATVESSHVNMGESFTLQLVLSGANAQGAPDISALQQSFSIVSKAPSPIAAPNNGADGDALRWQLKLLPKREGRITIPPVTVKTSDGQLRTAPVVIDVDHAAAPIPSQTALGGSSASISATASIADPYQNQSLQYTVRCVIRGNVWDASLGDVSVTDAIVERQGEPEVHDEFENGTPVKIIETHYIITPLHPGALVIPAAVMQGKISSPDMSSSLGGGLSGRMRDVMDFFSSFGDEPFTVASKEIRLEVKPPATTMDPWLPLTSLKIIEDINGSQSVRVGQPLFRKITILADGAVGSQLPDLETKQAQKNFRAYADRATTGEDLDKNSGAILGWRKESYTLIPQKPGPALLPAIKISWWDIADNKIATAELPGRIINVAPGAVDPGLSPPNVRPTDQIAPNQSSKARRGLFDAHAVYFYGLAGATACVFLFILFFGFRWVRKRLRQRSGIAGPSAQPELQCRAPRLRPATKRDLEKIRTAEELQKFLQNYAYAHCKTSRYAPLDTSILAQSRSWTTKEREDVDAVVKAIDAAVYAGKAIEVEALKSRSLLIIAMLNKRPRNTQRGGERLRMLNPS